MSRFVNIGGYNLNVDKIRSYNFNGSDKGRKLIVEMDNGDIYTDYSASREDFILGHDHIVQVIPCTKPLYMRYRDGEEFREDPVHYLALCGDGYIRPLEVCGCEGFFFADDFINYLGLYPVSMEEEGKENE